MRSGCGSMIGRGNPVFIAKRRSNGSCRRRAAPFFVRSVKKS